MAPPSPRPLAWGAPLVLLMLGALAGCALSGGAPALVYRLDTEISQLPAVAPRPTRMPIEVLPLRSNRPRGGSLGIALVHVGQVARVGEFGTGRWEESPERALERGLRAGLGRAAPELLVTAGEGALAALSRRRLHWALERFEMVEPAAAPAHVVVALSYSLQRLPERKLLVRGEIREVEPLAREAPLDEVVAAFGRASGRALSALLHISVRD